MVPRVVKNFFTGVSTETDMMTALGNVTVELKTIIRLMCFLF